MRNVWSHLALFGCFARLGLAVMILFKPLSILAGNICSSESLEEVVLPMCGTDGSLTPPKFKVGTTVRDMTAQEKADVLLAYEIWDGTRYQDMKCSKTSEGEQRAEKRGIRHVFESVTGIVGMRLKVIGPGSSEPEASEIDKAGSLICPGPPVTILLPSKTIRDALAIGGPDFLAFIMAHELGHRASAMTEKGDRLLKEKELQSRYARLGIRGNDRYSDFEKMADYRAAFYAGLAGYNMANLAKQNVVDFYLSMVPVPPEHSKKQKEQREDRARSLMQAFQDFDAITGVYQTAILMLVSGDVEPAVILLEWLNGQLKMRDVHLPEVKLAHALALMARASYDSPWLIDAPEAFRQHVCTPVFPLWPAMHMQMERGGILGSLRGGRTKEDVKEELETALGLLNEAEKLGLPLLVVTSARACAYLYLGDLAKARNEQREAERLAREAALKPVLETLLANRALIDCVPKPGSRTAWERATACILQKNKRLAEKGPKMASVKPSATGWPKGLGVPKVPEFPDLMGQCPTGYALKFSLPDKEAAEEMQSRYGVTGCVMDGRPDVRTIHIRTMASDRPPSSAVDRTLLVVEDLSDEAKQIDTWQHACTVEERGMTDQGLTVYRGSCNFTGSPETVVLLGNSKGNVKALIISR